MQKSKVKFKSKKFIISSLLNFNLKFCLLTFAFLLSNSILDHISKVCQGLLEKFQIPSTKLQILGFVIWNFIFSSLDSMKDYKEGKKDQNDDDGELVGLEFA